MRVSKRMPIVRLNSENRIGKEQNWNGAAAVRHSWPQITLWYQGRKENLLRDEEAECSARQLPPRTKQLSYNPVDTVLLNNFCSAANS